MFVVRDVGGFETLERIAQLGDLSLKLQSLLWFDVRGANGYLALANSSTGDTLSITNAPSWWYEDSPPYQTTDFTISQVRVRIQRSATSTTSPQGLQLTNYLLSADDIGRWVYLEGFTDPGNNGWAQILSYLGNTARVSKVFTSNGSGTANFRVIEINPSAPGLEPKYFPTKVANLTWTIQSGATTVAVGDGGATLRVNGASDSRFLSTRFTTLTTTAQEAEDLFLVCRQQVDALQRASTQVQDTFTGLITHTIGP